MPGDGECNRILTSQPYSDDQQRLLQTLISLEDVKLFKTISQSVLRRCPELAAPVSELMAAKFLPENLTSAAAATATRPSFPSSDSPAYREALRFTLPPKPVEKSALTVRVDPELGRLCIALGRAPELRVWLVARHLANGRGWLELDKLREWLRDFGIHLSARQLRRIHAQGVGVFWTFDAVTGRLYLRGVAKVAASLVAQASPHLTATNRPGMLRDVLLSMGGKLAYFEAMLYAGWMAAKDDPKIARVTLTMLFNRDKRTLRRWEELLGDQTIERVESFAQIADPQQFHPPAHSFAYVAAVRPEPGASADLLIRVCWQLPNTYRTKGIKQHPKRGQGRKVLAGLLPLDSKAEGMHRNPRIYFQSSKRLRSTVRKWGTVRHYRYLWLGVNRKGQQMYEPNENGFPDTTASERTSRRSEGRTLGKVRRKMWESRL